MTKTCVSLKCVWYAKDPGEDEYQTGPARHCPLMQISTNWLILASLVDPRMRCQCRPVYPDQERYLQPVNAAFTETVEYLKAYTSGPSSDKHTAPIIHYGDFIGFATFCPNAYTRSTTAAFCYNLQVGLALPTRTNSYEEPTRAKPKHLCLNARL